MSNYPSNYGKHRFTNQGVTDCVYATRKIDTHNPAVDDRMFEDEKWDSRTNFYSEILKICQALLLSTYMLLLSYHSVSYGPIEYSVLPNGKITRGYTNKAVVTVSFGYSLVYSIISVLAIGMLAYSLVSKNAKWSLPSIVLYLADLVYDVSGAIVAIWLFFSNFPLLSALLYTLGAILLILGEIWIWLGVLQLYEHRTFK